MNGYPKYMNSKDDVLNCLGLYAEKTKAYLKELLDTKDCWLMIKKLDVAETGLTDDTHKVVDIEDQTTGAIVERYQYEFMEDPNGPIFRLGFTVDEVTQLAQ